jgi:hypothetical protein
MKLTLDIADDAIKELEDAIAKFDAKEAAEGREGWGLTATALIERQAIGWMRSFIISQYQGDHQTEATTALKTDADRLAVLLPLISLGSK